MLVPLISKYLWYTDFIHYEWYFYYLKNSDYWLQGYYYSIHKVSVDASFGLLQIFLPEFGNLHGTLNWILVLVNRIRRIYQRGVNKELDSKFHVSSRVWQDILEECRTKHRPKRYEYNNKGKDNSPITPNDKDIKPHPRYLDILIVYFILIHFRWR